MSKIATGLDVGRVAGKMQTKATEALKGGDIWNREFAKGVMNWSYWMRIIMPYLYRAITPAMTPEQRQVAVKEYIKRVRNGLPLFLIQCAMAASEYAMTVVPVRAMSPYKVISPELIV
ncbi:MAG: hypothetical protein QW510_05785 [Candidatus Bathyarchaeia archaeon]